MATPVAPGSTPTSPPKPFIESKPLFFVLEIITIAASSEVYRNTRSMPFSLITFVAGTGFAIKPYTVWRGFITFLNSLPDAPTTYIGDSSRSRCRPNRRGPDVVVIHQQPSVQQRQDVVVVHDRQQDVVVIHKQVRTQPAASAAVTNGQRAVSKRQQHPRAAPAPIVTDGRRAQAKKR